VSEQPAQKTKREGLPVLLGAVGVGLILIISGVAVRSGQNRTLAAYIESTATAIRQQTPSPTATDKPVEGAVTSTEEPANTPTVTAEPSASPTPRGIDTPVPTVPTPTLGPPTFTPFPTPVPTRAVNTGNFATPAYDSPVPVPEPAEVIPIEDGVTNVLLLGSDRRANGEGTLTDTIIVVSINMNEGTVNMLSLPRDMAVYVPGYRITKINTVYSRGESNGWEGGGFGLLQETLLYNFGIQVGHYALVDLSGFQGIVNALGGVEVPVDCTLTGYVLKQPRQSVYDFATYDEWIAYTAPDSGNWELYTLPIGVHHLDGYMALWYARYRYGTSDFDRAFRQQRVLRAIAETARANGFLNIPRIPALWREYNDLVETSMDLGNMLQFAPIAADLKGIEINSYVLTPDLMTAYQDPNLNQTAYLPNPEALVFVQQAMQTPAQNYIISNSVSVEVRNGTSTDRLDEVGADRLILNGIDAVATGPADARNYDRTVIYDFTGRNKTSQLLWMQRNLHVADADVIVQPDPNRLFDYVVILGNDYRSCTRAPQAEQAPVPTPSGATDTGTGG